jgi:5-methylcytosine-specific restriction endonuclease McrA
MLLVLLLFLLLFLLLLLRFLPEGVRHHHYLVPGCTSDFDPPEADHIMSVAHGGESMLSNYQATHRSCNRRKGGKTRRR